jgi:hypothetical protein
MKNKYFILSSQFKYNNNNVKRKYLATIIKDSDNEEHIINVGDKKNKCITINIPFKNDEAIITDISFHEKCCINGILEKKKDMVQLVKCSLIFCLSHFSHLKKFIFTDNSFINCSNGSRMSLSLSYYIKYKKTWYQKMFNALSNNNDSLINIITKIEESLDKKLKLNLDIFLDTFYSISKNDEKLINKITKIYKKNMTLRSFLHKVIKYECSYYVKLVNTLIDYKFSDLTWIIKSENIYKYNSICNFVKLKKPKPEHKIINTKAEIYKRHNNNK